MAYLARAQAQPGTRVQLKVRDRLLPGTVVALPFVAHRYARPA
jgi:aminomethyltransferase